MSKKELNENEINKISAGSMGDAGNIVTGAMMLRRCCNAWVHHWGCW